MNIGSAVIVVAMNAIPASASVSAPRNRVRFAVAASPVATAIDATPAPEPRRASGDGAAAAAAMSAERDVVPSTVTVMRHPVHPMMVVFPLSFMTSTLLADVLYLVTERAFWAEASLWLAAGGLLSGLAAGMVGMIDFFTMPAVRRRVIAWSHFLAAVMALALAGANVQLRWDDPAAAVWPVGLMLAGTMAAIVGFAGWLGGTLTFKHGIGSYD